MIQYSFSANLHSYLTYANTARMRSEEFHPKVESTTVIFLNYLQSLENEATQLRLLHGFSSANRTEWIFERFHPAGWFKFCVLAIHFDEVTLYDTKQNVLHRWSHTDFLRHQNLQPLCTTLLAGKLPTQFIHDATPDQMTINTSGHPTIESSQKNKYPSTLSRLHAACKADDPQSVRRILEEANIDVDHASEYWGWVSIHYAAQANAIECAKLLFREMADVDARDASGQSPLHLATVANHLPMVVWLIMGGADENAQDAMGYTALHWAAYMGHEKIVSFLLRAGANPLLENSEGLTPLGLLTSDDQRLIKKCFVQRIHDMLKVNSDESSPLHKAVREQNQPEILSLLEKGICIENRDSRRRTALHYAARLDNHLMLQLLLNRGASIHAKDEHGETPLHLAADHDHRLENVKILIDHGAIVDEIDCTGMTPLMVSCQNDATEVMEFLLQMGADYEAVDYEGISVFEYTRRNPVTRKVLQRHLIQQQGIV